MKAIKTKLHVQIGAYNVRRQYFFRVVSRTIYLIIMPRGAVRYHTCCRSDIVLCISSSSH